MSSSWQRVQLIESKNEKCSFSWDASSFVFFFNATFRSSIFTAYILFLYFIINFIFLSPTRWTTEMFHEMLLGCDRICHGRYVDLYSTAKEKEWCHISFIFLCLREWINVNMEEIKIEEVFRFIFFSFSSMEKKKIQRDFKSVWMKRTMTQAHIIHFFLLEKKSSNRWRGNSLLFVWLCVYLFTREFAYSELIRIIQALLSRKWAKKARKKQSGISLISRTVQKNRIK